MTANPTRAPCLTPRDFHVYSIPDSSRVSRKEEQIDTEVMSVRRLTKCSYFLALTVCLLLIQLFLHYHTPSRREQFFEIRGEVFVYTAILFTYICETAGHKCLTTLNDLCLIYQLFCQAYTTQAVLRYNVPNRPRANSQYHFLFRGRR